MRRLLLALDWDRRMLVLKVLSYLGVSWKVTTYGNGDDPDYPDELTLGWQPTLPAVALAVIGLRAIRRQM